MPKRRSLSKGTVKAVLLVSAGVLAGVFLGFHGKKLYEAMWSQDTWELHVTVPEGTETYAFHQRPSEGQLGYFVEQYRRQAHFPEGQDFGAPRFQIESRTRTPDGTVLTNRTGLLSVGKFQSDDSRVQVALQDALGTYFTTGPPKSLDDAWTSLKRELWQEMRDLDRMEETLAQTEDSWRPGGGSLNNAQIPAPSALALAQHRWRSVNTPNE